jgi:DNA-binding transcriptional regulator YiaG
MQGQGRALSDIASETPTKLPGGGEKATERPEDAQEAAAAFKAMRETLGCSILDLSAWLRVPPRTLYAWEDGTMQVNPTAWLLMQILIKFPNVQKWVTPPSLPQRRKWTRRPQDG